MHVNSSQLNHIGGYTPIAILHSTTFLGIHLDCTFNWSKNLENVSLKISSENFVLNTLVKFCDLATLKLVYRSIIHSDVAYGIDKY